MIPDVQTHHHTPGKLYGVGVGPGAPDLLTRRAERVLSTSPVICLPAGPNGKSYAGGIIEGILDYSRQEVLYVHFPMQREQELALPSRDLAANMVLERLLVGQQVAFVTEGDPLLYSTFGYLLERVRQRHPEIVIEVVPGVSSITAAAASACFPLVTWSERLAVLPAAYVLTPSTSTDLRHILHMFDTVVLLKVNAVFDALLSVLEELELVHHAVFVRRCSTDLEEVIFDLTRLHQQRLDYFSLVIVRNPYAPGSK